MRSRGVIAERNVSAMGEAKHDGSTDASGVFTASNVVQRGLIDLQMWDSDLPAVKLDDGQLLVLKEPIQGLLGEQFSAYNLFSSVPFLDEAGVRQEGYCLAALATICGEWIRGDASEIETNAQREILRRCNDFLVALAFYGVDGIKIERSSTRTPERTAELAPWLLREVH
jgi:hypothetical protein